MSRSDPHFGPSFVGDCEGTHVAVAPRDLSGSSESTGIARSWVEALDRLEARRQRWPDETAFGVLVHRPGTGRPVRGGVLFSDGRSAEPLSLVFGRHPGCDVKGLRDASLRHALLLAWPDAGEGEAPIEVIDLRSRSGLVVSRHEVARHLTSRGPLRFALGRDEVTILHAPPGDRFAAELPSELDGWIEVEREAAASSRQREATNLSLVARRGDGSLFRLADGRQFHEDDALVVRTSRRRLGRGLLLGRYNRCDEWAGLARHRNISRVHALVLERRGALYAIDVGSTNGTVVVDSRCGEEVTVLDDARRAWRLRPWDVLELGGRRVALEVAPSVH